MYVSTESLYLKIAVPTKLKVIQIRSRDESRDASQENGNSPGKSQEWLRLRVGAVEEVRSSQIQDTVWR